MSVQTIKLEINGMSCEHCAQTISKKVSKLEGIISKAVNYPERKGEFEFDSDKVSKSEIIDAINSTGHYKVIDEIESNKNKVYHYDLIIIGGGSAAFTAAIKASELEKKVLMINDGLPIGGTCVNVGCVPSKTLIRTAEQFHIANHPNFSSIKSGNNKINFKAIVEQKRRLVDELRQAKYVDVIKKQTDIRIIEGRARFVSQDTVAVNGEEITSNRILVATGASPF